MGAIERQVAERDVPIREVQAHLRRQKQVLDLPEAAEKGAAATHKATEKGADAREDAASDKRDADYAVAKEKCEAFAGDAKSNCMSEAKVRFGK